MNATLLAPLTEVIEQLFLSRDTAAARLGGALDELRCDLGAELTGQTDTTWVLTLKAPATDETWYAALDILIEANIDENDARMEHTYDGAGNDLFKIHVRKPALSL